MPLEENQLNTGIIAKLNDPGVTQLNELSDVDLQTDEANENDILSKRGSTYIPFDPPYGTVRSDRFGVNDGGWNQILEGAGVGTGHNAINKTLDIISSSTDQTALILGHDTFVEIADGGGLEQSIGFMWSKKIKLGDIGSASRTVGDIAQVGIGFSATTDGAGTYNPSAKKFCALVEAENTGSNSSLRIIVGDPDDPSPQFRFVYPLNITQNDLGGVSGVGGEIEIAMFMQTSSYQVFMDGRESFSVHVLWREVGKENWTPTRGVGPTSIDTWTNSPPVPLAGELRNGARPFLYARTKDASVGGISQTGAVVSGSGTSITSSNQRFTHTGGALDTKARSQMFLHVKSGTQAGFYKIASVDPSGDFLTLDVTGGNSGFTADDLTPGMTYDIYASLGARISPPSFVYDQTRDFSTTTAGAVTSFTIAGVPPTTGIGQGVPPVFGTFPSTLATPTNGAQGIVEDNLPSGGDIDTVLTAYSIAGADPGTGANDITHEIDELRFIQILAGLEITIPGGIENVQDDGVDVQSENTLNFIGFSVVGEPSEGRINISNASPTVVVPIDLSHSVGEADTLVAQIGIGTVIFPVGFTIEDIHISCRTPPTGSSILVDIDHLGSTIMSQRPEIEVSETTSVDATNPPSLIGGTKHIPAGEQIAFHLDQVGSTVAGSGLKVYLVGKWD